MLPPSSQKKSLQRENFDLGLHASHHLKNNPPKGRIPKRWDKNPVQEILPEGRIIDRILLMEGYLHVSTFYSGEACNQSKPFPTQKVGKLMPNRVPDQRWQVISVDIIGKLPESRGYNAILVVVDWLSKHIHAIPTVTSLDSEGVVQLFLEHVGTGWPAWSQAHPVHCLPPLDRWLNGAHQPG